MEGVKNIEALSLLFTAGVAAGTLVSVPASGVLPGLLLPLLALPVLLRGKLREAAQRQSVPLLLGTFLLLGFFCARSAVLPSVSVESGLERLSQNVVLRLRALIGSIPFPSEGSAPLLLALLTGDRSALAPETVTAFRDSGASHILALSGLHIGIIYLLFDHLTRVLGKTPAARYLRFALITLGAGFFTLMTGAGPSIVRAFLFILINETLRLLNRPRKPVRVLCLALLIQLVLDPAVIGSIGFQLSYLAMSGIFLLYPILEKWYPEGSAHNPLRRIWQAAALSISCQLFTAPLVWYRFHSFPRHFLLTNLLAIPLTTLLMGTAVVTVTLWGLGICPALLVTVTDALCRLLTGVLEIIAAM